ncbi:DUF3237 domain-containing protein [Sphingobium sp. SA2]|uniref:DUF3237 domain-containing protein n=1 Tax=Sphingobium sp. SA2 TaxID=1524832 RepID=UPI0028C1BD3B|nr:DUF3237 domain-containing protein [Sphingobium sp. SA2]MDT7533418.1 DUF3237 domain-containing protein [Sphingobium sp. SA2]
MDNIFSTIENPKLEFAMEVRLQFPRVQTIANSPWGGTRSAVYVESGTFEGPRLRGKAVPGSGGDYAYFRPDDVAVFDARYMLEEEDGTLILLNNRGFLWGRKHDTMEKLRDWAFREGEPVEQQDYYLRGNPSFECSVGKHDWLTKHVFVGVGERRADGNVLRYYALT